MHSSFQKILFFDIGGVLLSNGWGHESRQAAATHFGFDYTEMNYLRDFFLTPTKSATSTLMNAWIRFCFTAPAIFQKKNLSILCTYNRCNCHHSDGVANPPLGSVLFAEWLHSPFKKGG